MPPPPEREEPQATGQPSLSHVVSGSSGPESRMVDVSAKPVTLRTALARARVRFPGGAAAEILSEGGPKGPICEVARTAAVLAAKRTGEWIPLCHPLGLDSVEVEFERLAEDLIEIRCRTSCHGRTGVEMEAMVAVSAAALTVYDMTKGLDHGIAIESVELLQKSGGRSGTWHRS